MRYWQELVVREKIAALIGAGVLCLMLLYTLVWAPFEHAVASKQTALLHKRRLLTWMQTIDRNLQQHHLSTTTGQLKAIGLAVNTSLASFIATKPTARIVIKL